MSTENVSNEEKGNGVLADVMLRMIFKAIIKRCLHSRVQNNYDNE
jgi:hypothetical protein